MTKTKLRVLPLILFLGVMLTHNANAEVDQHLCAQVKLLYSSHLRNYNNDDDAAKKADMLAHHLVMLGCINASAPE